MGSDDVKELAEGVFGEYFGIPFDDGLPDPVGTTVEEKRRELFEAWDSKTFADFDHELDGLGGYTDNIVQQCWMAFNAALDAIEIELPGIYVAIDMSPGEVLDACLENINSLNLGIKVKS